MNETFDKYESESLAARKNADLSGGRIEVSADLLNEAVLQLRKLSGIRQREAERQERAIAQLHTALKRQGRLNRFLLLVSLLVIAAALFSGYLAWKSAGTGSRTARSLEEMGRQLDANNDVVRNDLTSARSSQEELARQVAEQLQAVRLERDQVRGEVRSVLDEKTRMMASQEAALRAEQAALEQARAKARQEQQALIQQTIQQLSVMSAELQADAPADVASEAVTPATPNASPAVNGVESPDQIQ